MSTACPSCGQDISEDFGFVNCSQCGALLVIDMDGNATIGNEATGNETTGNEEAESEDFNPENSAPENSVISENEEFVASEESEDFLAAEEFQEEPLEEGFDEAETDFETSEESSEEHFEAEAEESEFEAGEFEDEGEFATESEAEDVSGEASDLDYGEGQVDVDASPHFAAGGTGLAQELEDYGNSDLSQAKDGLLRFNILISGIDTPDIRYAIKEALTDRKFIWEPNEILATIQNGELKIEGITAVKAVLVVKRIRNLPIEIKWEQYAINQT